jgi:hypothetical protein
MWEEFCRKKPKQLCSIFDSISDAQKEKNQKAGPREPLRDLLIFYVNF